jgi:hypothetical protein
VGSVWDSPRVMAAGSWRRRLLWVGLVLAATVAGAEVCDAATQSSPLVPGTGLVAGRGYGQWVAAAIRWRISQPDVTSNRTACLSAGQRGAVWFRDQSDTHAAVIRITCAVPAGHYMLLDGPSSFCSTLDSYARTSAGLRLCARRRWNQVQGSETVTLDGVKLSPPGYVGGTAAFAFTMPAHNNWLQKPGHTHGRMAVYGDATVLRPLRAGAHILVETIWFRGSRTFTNRYQLTVG